MSDGEDTVVDLQEELENLYGSVIVSEIRGLNRSLAITSRNCEILLEAEAILEEEGLEYFSQSNPEKSMDEYQLEYLRRLHNYISSVYSLINHTQRVVDKYGDEEFKEHYEEVLRERGLVQKGEFLRQLRHYTQKRKLPPITASVRSTRDNPDLEYDVYIPTEDLLDWDEWNADARGFLEDAEEEIDLDEVIREYNESIQDFYDWFFRFLGYFHIEELREWYSTRAEIGTQLEEKHPDLVETYRKNKLE